VRSSSRWRRAPEFSSSSRATSRASNNWTKRRPEGRGRKCCLAEAPVPGPPPRGKWASAWPPTESLARNNRDTGGEAAPEAQRTRCSCLLDASNRRFGGTNSASAGYGEAPFPTPFADARNLVVGPLILVGTPTCLRGSSPVTAAPASVRARRRWRRSRSQRTTSGSRRGSTPWTQCIGTASATVRSGEDGAPTPSLAQCANCTSGGRAAASFAPSR
jgi:hypothetical protein